MAGNGRRLRAERGAAELPRARALRVLRDWISSGRLGPGHVLPPERALARELDVSRSTLRLALSILKREGLLRMPSPRTRMITDGLSSPAADLVQGSVLVLSSSATPPAGPGRSGRSDYITLGAMSGMQQAGRAVLSCDPQRALVGGYKDLRSYGVLMPEIAAPSNEASALDQARRVMEQAVAAGVPVVVYGDVPENASFDRVTSDYESGAYQLTTWLVRQGRRRILNLWPQAGAESWSAGRRAGYERAMREAGLEPLPVLRVPPLAEDASTPEQFARHAHHVAGYLVRHLVGPHPVDAILAASDRAAYSVAAACRMFGKEPQKDVWVAAYEGSAGDIPERGFEPSGPVVTMDRQDLLIGQEMARLLIERAEGRLPPEPQRRVVAPRLSPAAGAVT